MTDKNKKESPSPGAALASYRKLHKKVCPVCDNEFEGIINKKTCSDKCRQIKSRKKITT